MTDVPAVWSSNVECKDIKGVTHARIQTDDGKIAVDLARQPSGRLALVIEEVRTGEHPMIWTFTEFTQLPSVAEVMKRRFPNHISYSVAEPQVALLLQAMS